MSEEPRYGIAYKVEAMANRTKEELLDRDEGGCDAIIVHSLIYPDDGSRSEQILSVDGRTGKPLPSIEMFKSWVSMAHALMHQGDLSPAMRELCRRVFETFWLGLAAAGKSDGGMVG